MRLVGDQANGGLAVGPSWMMNQNPNWNTQVPDIAGHHVRANTAQTGMNVTTYQSNAQEGLATRPTSPMPSPAPT